VAYGWKKKITEISLLPGGEKDGGKLKAGNDKQLSLFCL
jgi:hypothetical protein